MKTAKYYDLGTDPNGAYLIMHHLRVNLGLLVLLTVSYATMTGCAKDSLPNESTHTNSGSLAAPTLLATINIQDPVDIKWTSSSNLYVLSGKAATVTEFDSRGTKIIRVLREIGKEPCCLDIDKSGNVYVALTGQNQVCKLVPTDGSFKKDTKFGIGGFIGNIDQNPGSNATSFKAPFGISVNYNSEEIAVTDSGNNRIQHFTAEGAFIESIEKQLQNIGQMKEFQYIGQMNGPKGLSYDFWNDLVIADSGNNRIVIASDIGSQKALGGPGSGMGQFKEPCNICASRRGLYVADTGNNRVQVFTPISNRDVISPSSPTPRLSLGRDLGLKQPKAVTAVPDPLEEKMYIADTGNNRVILVKLALDNPEATWKSMKARLVAGDIPGAISYFSVASKGKYEEGFRSLSKAELTSDANDLGTIKPVYLESGKAEYVFEIVLKGQKMPIPVKFVKENGVWKIFEY